MLRISFSDVKCIFCNSSLHRPPVNLNREMLLQESKLITRHSCSCRSCRLIFQAAAQQFVLATYKGIQLATLEQVVK